MIRIVGLLLVAAGLAGQSALATPDRWRAGGFTTDFSKHAVPLDEILSGGPPKDGIPSIDAPRFQPVNEVTDLIDTDPVIQVLTTGAARAYPLRVLIWHEIVNDEIDGRPLTVTYCPLCNSAIVFERQVGEEVLDFGTTGLLRHSDLVMYDRQTETFWQQFTGEAIVGAMTGTTLKMIPSRTLPFGLFRELHPNGKLLVPENTRLRDYGRNPYVGYDSRAAPYPLYQGGLPADLPPMARVIVVHAPDRLHAITLDAVRAAGRIELDDGAVAVTWRAGMASALDTPQLSGGRDVGHVEALLIKDNSAEPLVHDVTFAFAVHAFHPGIEVRQD